MPIDIGDPGDPRVELYCGLRDSELRRRLEGGHGVFVVEGARSVRQLLQSRWRIRSLLLRPERLGALADVVDAAARAGAPVYVAGQATFDRIAGFPVHRGVLAVAERRPDPDGATLLARAPLAVIAEGINDHENLGAVFRNAAAFGAGAVLLDPTCCDPLYRRSVRVSVGHVLRVPFARLTPWPAALTTLVTRGVSVVALDPAAPDTIESVARRRPVALLVGAEGSGLSAASLAVSTQRARIAMAPGVDSLNVATAVAVALYWLTSGGARPEVGV